MAMYGARLHSGACKHYNMRSVLHRIFWNEYSVLSMSGAVRVTIIPYIHTYKQIAQTYRLCGARPGLPQLGEIDLGRDVYLSCHPYSSPLFTSWYVPPYLQCKFTIHFSACR